MFGDLDIQALESDPLDPGVFICAKQTNSPEPDLSKIELYSIVLRKKAIDVSDAEISQFKVRYRVRRRFWKIWPKVLRFGFETDWV